MRNPFLFILFAPVLLVVACSHVQETPEARLPDKSTVNLNRYLNTLFQSAYLWAEQVPQDVDPYTETDPYVFFEKMCYRQEDKWSRLIDDREANNDRMEGVETTFGYGLAFGVLTDGPDGNPKSYFAVVQYVYPNAPAQQAGLQRGDVIVAMNGQAITQDNYTDLYYAADLMLALKDGRSIGLRAARTWLNPVLATRVVEQGGTRVGYLCYKGFTGQSQPLIDQVMKMFKEAGVTEVVLDLRYNNGGYDHIARYLCSTLAPARLLGTREVLTQYIWNPFFDSLYGFFYEDDIYLSFMRDVAYNLDLKRLYVLTGPNTASASELTIVCLQPYLDVTTIGRVTAGKYVGSITFHSTYTDISHWAAQLIVFKYANANGFTDFKDGLTPDVPMTERLLEGVRPLGDPREDLFAAALARIASPGESSKYAGGVYEKVLVGDTQAAVVAGSLLPPEHPMNRFGQEGWLVKPFDIQN